MPHTRGPRQTALGVCDPELKAGAAILIPDVDRELAFEGTDEAAVHHAARHILRELDVLGAEVPGVGQRVQASGVQSSAKVHAEMVVPGLIPDPDEHGGRDSLLTILLLLHVHQYSLAGVIMRLLLKRGRGIDPATPPTHLPPQAQRILGVEQKQPLGKAPSDEVHHVRRESRPEPAGKRQEFGQVRPAQDDAAAADGGGGGRGTGDGDDGSSGSSGSSSSSSSSTAS